MKKDLLDYFKTLMDYYGKYHQHKELSAWAGIVLHILFCTVAIRFTLPATSKLVAFIALLIAVLFVAVLAFLYIKNQLEMKDAGGALAGAAAFFLTEILCSDEPSLKCEKYVTPPQDSPNTKAQAHHVLPKAMLEKAEILNTRGRGFQDGTRWLIYGLLVVSTVGVVGLKTIEAFG